MVIHVLTMEYGRKRTQYCWEGYRGFRLSVVLLLSFFCFSNQTFGQCKPGSNTINIPSLACNGKTLTFSYTGDSSAVSYVWLWGDGSRDSLNNRTVTHNYGADSVYYITFVRVFAGCQDTLTDSVVVRQSPSPAFTFSPDSICGGTAVSFTNTSSDTSGATFLWRFSDPSSGGANTSTLSNPSHTFNSPSPSAFTTYPVKLIVTNTGSCIDSVTRNVTLKPKPAPGFNISPNDSVCSGTTISFTNTTNPGSGLSYSWNFGDTASGSNTSSSQNPNHTFVNPDTSGVRTYSVKLRVTNAFGCTDSIIRTIYVQANNLNAAFNTTADSLCANSNFQFNFTGYPQTGLNYSWNFDDAGSASNTSSSQNPTHSYNFAYGSGISSYNPRLIITSLFGCRDTATRTVHVHRKPQPSVEDSCNTYGGTGIPFVNCSATISNQDFEICLTNTTADTSIVSHYHIIWGDGQDTTVSNTEFETALHHLYTTIGNYTLRIEAVGKNGCTGDTTYNVVNESNPSVGISTFGSTSGCAPATFAYILNASNVSPTTRFVWRFGDGSAPVYWDYTRAHDTIFHTFDTSSCPQQFSVTITAIGLCDSTQASVSGTRVYMRPDSRFTTPLTNCVGTPVQFTNTTPPSSGVNCSAIRNFRWRFGDPGSGASDSSTSNSPTHTYSRAGVYNVRLITSNTCGADTVIQQIVVDTVPVPRFNDSIYGNGCMPTTIKFVDSSYGGNLRYRWFITPLVAGSAVTYDSNTTDSSQSPVVTFHTAGIYRVTLQLTNSCGVRSVSDTIIISQPPDVALSAIANFCQPAVINPAPTIDTGFALTTYLWTFPGGSPTSSTQRNPGSITYSAAGTYTVKLVATNKCGSDSATRTFTVHALPQVRMGVDDSTQCFTGHTFNLTDSSTVPGGSVASRLWRFSDGTTSSSANPSKTFATPGTYTVRLVVTSNNNCRDSIERTLIVYPNASVAFNINDTDQCRTGNSFTFTDASTLSSGSISSRTWTFGDGGSSGSNPVSHSYSAAGTYVVKLVVVTDNGCRDSLSRNVYVFPQPQPVISINDTDVCLGGTFQFADSSTISSGTLTSRLWRFGDGSTSSSASPSKTYAAAGTYPVTLVVTSNRGCIDSVLRNVVVYPGPVVNFGINDSDQCMGGHSFTFTDSTTLSSGTITSRLWRFGDGTTSSSTNPVKTYTAPGTYTVRLIVSSSNGCADSLSKTVFVYPDPNANFGFTQPCFPASVQFTDSSTVASGTITSRDWDFGDGSTSTQTNPSKSYSASGTYNVRLIVTTNRGCRDTITRTITVNPLPTVKFGINDSDQCTSGNNFAFTDSSSVSPGSITSRLWRFGDGGTSTSVNPTHSYAAAGTYTVTLRATTANGCTDSVSRLVIVFASPTVSFGINDTDQCLSGNSFTFSDSSTVSGGSVSSRSWTFGDGGSSSSNPAAHSYSAPGTYQVRLRVTSNQGCIDSVTRQVSVYAPPVVKFGINDSDQCLGSSFVFTDSSTVSSGSISSRTWRFGDGGTSSLTNPSHTYADSGTYTVKLIVVNQAGCRDSATRQVIVFPGPVARFGINDSDQCLAGNQFNFSDSSTVSSGSIASHSWTFGDGGTSASANPSHTYASPGSYQVKLRVVSSNGCSDSVTRQVIVYPDPDAVIGVNDTDQCSGLAFSFTDNSFYPGSVVTSRTWRFGDGGTSSAANPSHTYAGPGTYTVTLIAVGGSGCTDSVSRNVTVFPLPRAGFSTNTPAQCRNGNNFQFTDTSSVSSGSIVTRAWSFGDGGTSSSVNPSHTYAAAGTYNVKLVVTTNNGCKDSVTHSVTVHPQPVANFGNTAPCFPSSVSFTDSSSVSTGSVTGRLWRFGDGDTSTSLNPTHTYASAGSYQVKLIVTSNNGCSDSITKTVSVFPKPNVSFGVNDTDQCLGSTFAFTDSTTLSGGSVSTMAWTFGDGGTSSSNNPTHNYASAGTFQVKLVVTSNNGCRDSASRSVIVFARPQVRFGVDDSVQCLTGNVFNFSDSTTVSGSTITGHTWRFGDGNTSALVNPAHTYAASGQFTVKLIATSAQGCVDSATNPVRIAPMPQAAFSSSDTAVCFGLPFNFTDNSTLSSGTISSRNWNFGDGNTSSVTNPSHTYAAAGLYTVRLRVTSNDGCQDTIIHNVRVNPQPSPAFTVNDSNQCLSGNSFGFTDGSSVASGSISTRAWTFGDGGTSSAINPSHTYAAAGSFIVKLVVTTDRGCRDSVQHNVIVDPQPVVNFGNTAPCFPSAVQFSDSTTITSGTLTTYRWTFGDGDSSLLVNPTHSYAMAGTYNVVLRVSSDKGCTDSNNRSVIVNPKPRAGFSQNDTMSCLSGNNFSFTDTSSVVSGSITTRAWTFGDGGSSSATNPTHSYASAGTYPVKLVVTSNNGCQDSVIRIIHVWPQPQVSYTVNDSDQCLGSNSYVFTNGSTVSSGSIVRYRWTFGTGDTSAQTSPAYAYVVPNTYQVKLVSYTDKGCRDSVTKPVVVYPMPVADFNTANACTGVSINFNDQSTVSSGTVNNWKWHFGTGDSSSAQNPSYTYNTSDTFPVRLIVTTAAGCRDTVIKDVEVYPLPTVDFDVTEVCRQQATQFTDQSSVNPGSIASRLWVFHDATNSSAVNPTKTYASAGTFNVKLIITTDHSCRDSLTQAATVNPLPVVNFGNTAPCFPSAVQFSDSTTITSGTLTTYRWTFGDGDSALVANPAHSYTVAGTYNVILRVSSDKGCTDSNNRSVLVFPKPRAGFSQNDTMSCLSGNNFSFTDTSSVVSGSITTRNWTFGDGGSSSATNPTHSYASAGTYSVKLVVTSNNGCQDSVIRIIHVWPQPQVSYTVNDSDQCLGSNSYVFTNGSTVSSGSIVRYRWTFGTGDTSAQTSPAYAYVVPNTYQVKLAAYTDMGCRDSVTKPVVVYPMPVADFNTANACTGVSINFNDQSTVSSGTVNNWKWHFGTGDSSSAQNPSYTYSASDTFTVRLIVTTAAGCRDTVMKDVEVYPLPTVDFDITEVCRQQATQFTDQSSVSPGSIASRLWVFHDGTNSSAVNPAKTYAAAGSFNVKLIITTDHSCRDSLTQTATVNPLPVVNFGNTAPCYPSAVQFSDSTTITSGTLTTYRWTFGDGDSSLAVNPSHNYTIAGTYNVVLRVSSDKGCTDSNNRSVIVNPKPRAGFSQNDTMSCLSGNNFSFTDTSSVVSGSITTRAWTFGDGGSSSATNPTHSYASAGTYSVKLVVTSNNGCQDSVIRIIHVWPQPQVSYTVNDSDQCLGSNSYVFTNGSTVSSGSIVRYRWTFGTGDTSAQTSPAYAYVVPNTYQVKLVSYTDKGCRDSVTKPVVVYPMPVADFNKTDVCFGLNTTFNDQSTVSSGSINAWKWYYGNGDSSATQSPSYQYAAADTYTVALVVTTAAGCKDTATRQVEVYPRPSVDFNITEVCRQQATQFTDNSVVSGGSIGSRLWRYHDGTTDSVAGPTKTYAAAGTFNVKLIITSNRGCRDSLTKQATVNPLPVVNFSNTVPCFPSAVVFTDGTNITPGTVSSRLWNFGDGDTSTQTNPSHTYAASGTYSVKLIATSDKNCRDSVSNNVIVNPKPRAGFSVNTDSICLVGNSFSFTDTSSVSSGTITTRTWTFGDGNGSGSTNPTHSYTSPGAYTVKLVVTTNNGCQDSITRVVNVWPRPNVSFTVNDSDQCVSGNNFVFTNGSSVSPGSITVYSWNFGDAGTSSAASPTHSYASAGSYTVKLIVTTDKGCRDSMTKVVVVYPKPTVGYRFTNVCYGLATQFTDTSAVSSGSVTNWSWTFGDGNNSSLQSPSYTYAAADTYTVKLVATTNNGCRDSSIQNVTVYPMPSVRFGMTEICYPQATSFTDTSVVTGGILASRLWRFHDGTTSTDSLPVKTYPAAGSYNVKLIITTDKGCHDSATKTATVRPLPSVNFTSAAVGCINSGFSFTNQSSGAASYTWHFGDTSAPSAAVNPVHNYTDTGFYNVKLIAQTSFGCRDSITRQIRITRLPVPAYALLPDTGCGPLQVTFNHTSTGYQTSYSWNFGNGQTSSSYFPSPVSYNASLYRDTTYVVTLTATNLCGSVSLNDTVTVFSKPYVMFGVDKLSGCTPLEVNISNLSKGNPTSYLWDFGDGTFYTDSNPRSHVYFTGLDDTTFRMRLRVTNKCGTDTMSYQIHVLPKNLNSVFLPDKTQGCAPLTVRFTDFSTGAESVAWDFDDGNRSTAGSPVHTFSQPGTYNVRQFIANQCTKDTSMVIITVHPVPTPDFIIPDPTQCAHKPIQFFNTSPDDGATTWYFGDGDSSSLSNPSHSYSAAGTYIVTLRLTSLLNNCPAYKSDTVFVDSLPRPSFIANPPDGCAPLPVHFVNTTTNAGYYSWKFGDGNSSAQTSPTYIYMQPGLYDVKLIAQNARGCVDSISDVVNVYPIPTSSFGFNPLTVCDGPADVTFTNTSTGAVGYSWDFGNGQSSTLTNPVNTYSGIGSYTITLISSNQFGCRDTSTNVFTIHPTPVANFQFAPPEGCAPLAVNFTNTTQFGVAYEWDFGDGSSIASDVNPLHVYFSPGVYTVTLRVNGQGICKDTAVKQNIIRVYPKPVANFSYKQSVDPEPYGLVHFTNLSSTDAIRYRWEFGDGDSSSAKDPDHQYRIYGPYTIRLIVFTADGCSDTITQNIDLTFFRGIQVPTAFTPDYGIPEVRIFKPVGIGLKSYHIRVFNTYGELMWESDKIVNTEPAEGWNGYYNGHICPQDVYVWKIDAVFLDGSVWPGMPDSKGKHHRTGTVTLIR